MAPKHQNGKTLETPQPAPWSTTIRLLRLTVLLLATAAISPISQLTLAPVYGAIPSSVNHKTMMLLSYAFGFMVKIINVRIAERQLPYLAALAAWIPVIQSWILPLSGQLGPVGGPVLTGSLSCHLLLIPSAYAIAEMCEEFKPHKYMPRAAALVVIAGVLAFPLYLLEQMFSRLASEHIWQIPGLVLTPVDLQLALAFAYAVLHPSRLVLLGAPALGLTVLLNPHYTRASVDLALQPHNWTLVDRQWSNTGYISILDSSEQQYRVMRCDHSLLGGEWLLTEQRKKKEGWKVNEPIYAVFEMLEAVRLLQVNSVIPDTEAHALIIGLGIGTAPKAFVSHGINTTTIELDPVVHDFATKYFGLPTNHISVIQDAVSWVENAVAQEEGKNYNYIIHDVFTGGAEPLILFTTQFLTNLRSLLTHNGVIALNYAGDLSVPLTRLVLHTISKTFSHQCKIYRDGLPESKEQHGNSDFLNMVVFCRNSPGPIAFRRPTAADFLGSKSRQHYMMPKPEHEIPFPAVSATHTGQGHLTQVPPLKHGDALYNAPKKAQALIPDGAVLELGDVGKHAKQQVESAVRHWHIMRKVLPDAVWELW
ncbi:hypothetical protein CLAFUW4_06133 [Fulvia fulva]|uniref:Uncharacterized protein n=1 Tax=Passalora fulva TaxID=5499 RepID=A0A9Q8LH19_PASFU|nr:uncharacterized protein CLAFUR5_06277 [Fulvia fulva]UJO17481.1 hypothetical protein CLAFUR5_06277 [Fulvia fulva]WPV15406.1 hypothetical protein CLAFUW4_06133 [Fulvia fulva]